MHNLTKAEAAARAQLIDTAQYDIEFDFTAPGDTFTTRTSVVFDSKAAAETFIDCIGDVQGVWFNGAELTGTVSPGRIGLPLIEGRNAVIVVSTHEYHSDGQGIHRFVDPETGKTYLYSQYAEADARSTFACFDQPDIKGRFAITVAAPASWEVVSNMSHKGAVPMPNRTTTIDMPQQDDGTPGTQPCRLWIFPRTPLIPTYVVACVAGPYAVAEGTLHSQKGEIKARVFGRLAAHLDADEMIGTVQKGIDLYEEKLGIPYPYEKYDQVFAPEFNLGAMENVGCVTFSEDRLVFRSKPTDALREARTNVVLHELAHMWFGNLVTMRWWDDLWLNESFAEFMGAYATTTATDWTDAWVTHTAGRKSTAYVQDQWPSTHPIVADVPDTDATVSAFDMITYAKGASALRQLVEFIGEDAFFAGTAAYLTKHSWGNATLAEYLHELEVASGRDLQRWADVWLESAGPSTLTPEVTWDDGGEITSLAILQDADVLRPHRLRVAGYTMADAGLASAWTLSVEVDGERTEVPEAVGRRADLLLINDGDLTYAKVRLDERSLRTVGYLAELDGAMPLALVLDSLWHAARDGLIPAQDYIAAVLDAMPVMTNSATLESHARTLTVALTTSVAPERLEAVAIDAAERLKEIVEEAAPGSDLQLQALKAFAKVARTSTQAELLAGLLDGDIELVGLELDQDLRWDLTYGLAAAGGPGIEDRIAAELERDPGAMGIRRAAGARAAIATPEAKVAAWDALMSGPSNATQYEIARGTVHVTDPALLAPMWERMTSELDAYYAANAGWVGSRVLQGLMPVMLAGRVDIAAQLEAWLESGEQPDVLRKIVSETLFEVNRALTAQQVL